jgi:hypothetical protein
MDKKLYLQAVVVNKDLGIVEAGRIFNEITQNKHKKNFYYRTTEHSIRFRNIPKTRFDRKSFRTKKVDEDVILIFGHLLDE